jgi:hypothetical protein
MSKPEVCEYLGKSKRTIETFVSRGRLGVSYFAGANGKTAQFRRAEVEALDRELKTPVHRATPQLEVYRPDPARGPDPFAGLAAHLAQLSQAFPSKPATVGAWLTLDAAAEASGLPKSYLLAQAKLGAPYALNVGSAERPRWRFRTESMK